MRLAVIPARGGSKRIPRKNIREFCGKPMIAWSIEAAQKSECFDRIIVSTDDDEIAEVAREFGAEVPFIRPAELADDYSGTIPVIAHATHWQNSNDKKTSQVCCIYATAPFLKADDLQRGLRILEDTQASYAFSVTSYAFPIQRAIHITTEQRVQMLQPEYLESRSQDLEESWHDAGQFYWGRADSWLNLKPIFSANTAAVVLPRERVQDIDTLEDWRVTEIKYSLLRSLANNYES